MRGTKPTVRQAKLITQMGLNHQNWLVQKDTSTQLQIVHRHTDSVRVIEKENVKDA